MIVMKFGGTSVAGNEQIRRTISIVASKLERRPIVVVSALSKVTDLLYKIADAAACSALGEANAHIEALRARHLELVDQLLESSPLAAEAAVKVNSICSELKEFISAVCALGELTDRSKAKIIANGEWLSSTIICYAMNAQGIKTSFVDARKMIITSDNYMKGEPQIEAICQKVPEEIGKAYEGAQAVITQGFISSAENGKTTVLGRGGSDYSASLIGMAVGAEVIEIWTDVDGVRTADPRVVPSTQSISKISFEEAAEMAHFGAKVLHPMTIEPAVMKNIPVYVLNSMNPQNEGTVILQGDMIEDGVKSVSHKNNILLLNLFSTKMINVSGFLQKIFAVFSEHKVSVDLISTSEATISLTLDASQQNIPQVLEDLRAFADVSVDDDKAQVSIIGKNLINDSRAHSAISALSDYKVYVISQGASAINVSFVVDKAHLNEVVNAVHNYLFGKEA